jgi:hypothetical protein
VSDEPVDHVGSLPQPPRLEIAAISVVIRMILSSAGY